MSPAPTARETRLHLGTRTRLPTRLDNGSPDGDPGPETESALAQALPQASARVLTGGEPTLRPDLLTLIRALSADGASPLTLHTDGLALTDPAAVAALRRAGLRRVRIDLHAYDPYSGFAAHNWLLRTPGAGARAAEALRVCRSQGLETEAELVVTRPTTPLLRSTVEALIALGAQRIRLRRLRAEGAAAADFVALSPRFGLAQPELLAAIALAERHRRPITVHGFPACAARADRCVSAQREPGDAAPTLPGCARCPGPPSCDGAPADYVARFGWSELRSEDFPPAALPADRRPPPRAGRSPATRVAATLARVADPPRAPSPTVRVAAHPDTPTRALRQHLVRAAEDGASELIFDGVLAHPEVVELLRDAARLPFTTLTATGPAARLPGEDALRRIRRWDRFFITLYGPDAARHDAVAGPGAFAASLQNAAALAAFTPAQVGACASLREASALPDWDAAWRDAKLPGEPRFCLPPDGPDADAIAAMLPQLSPATREALARAEHPA